MIDRRGAILGGIACGALLKASPAHARLVNGGTPFPEPDASTIVRLLGSAPYIEEGTGSDILYVRTSDRCVSCAAMGKRYPGPIPGFRTRYYLPMFVHSDKFAMLRLLRARTPAAFRQYMHGQLSTAPINLTAADVALLNATLDVDDRVRQITMRLDPNPGYGTPVFHRVRAGSVVGNYGYGEATIASLAAP